MFSNKGISVPSGFSLQNNTHDKSLNDSKVTLGKILQCFHINARSIINVSKSCKCQLNKTRYYWYKNLGQTRNR